jgi:nucleoside-diphosphate-sugar epimerase
MSNSHLKTRQLLIVGAGDIAERALPTLLSGFSITAMVRTAERAQALRSLGAETVLADLDRPETLSVLPAAECLLHSAPPQLTGARDERTRHLIAALDQVASRQSAAGAAAAGIPRRPYPRRVVYVSTSGVYGDCAGAEVDESRPTHPATDRARRRVDAETMLSEWAAARGIQLVVLRAPGIYGDGRFPVERLRKGTPVLQHADDVYTNHIHAADLAAICATALDERVPPGVYNTVDDSEIRMGDWLDLVADTFGLARPPRIPRSEAAARIPAPLLSFMSESRRLSNARLKRDFGYALRYPTVMDGLRAAVKQPERAA